MLNKTVIFRNLATNNIYLLYFGAIKVTGRLKTPNHIWMSYKAQSFSSQSRSLELPANITVYVRLYLALFGFRLGAVYAEITQKQCLVRVYHSCDPSLKRYWLDSISFLLQQYWLLILQYEVSRSPWICKRLISAVCHTSTVTFENASHWYYLSERGGQFAGMMVHDTGMWADPNINEC